MHRPITIFIEAGNESKTPKEIVITNTKLVKYWSVLQMQRVEGSSSPCASSSSIWSTSIIIILLTARCFLENKQLGLWGLCIMHGSWISERNSSSGTTNQFFLCYMSWFFDSVWITQNMHPSYVWYISLHAAGFGGLFQRCSPKETFQILPQLRQFNINFALVWKLFRLLSVLENVIDKRLFYSLNFSHYQPISKLLRSKSAKLLITVCIKETKSFVIILNFYHDFPQNLYNLEKRC